jgi:lysophospholipase L1-like esterase
MGYKFNPFTGKFDFVGALGRFDFPLVAALGDRITEGAISTSGNNVNFHATGYAAWVPILMRQCVTSPYALNFGVSGEASSQILARVGSVLSSGASVCVVHAGANDTAGVDTRANLAAIYDALYAAGIYVIAVPILPRAGASAYSTALRDKHHATNRWIRMLRGVRKMFAVADAEAVYGDPTSASWTIRSGYSLDDVHPSQAGAQAIAQQIVDILRVITPDGVTAYGAPSDLYSADNVTGNRLTNGGMLGTGGTLDSSVTTTGPLADSWRYTDALAGGATVVLSKSTMSDGRPCQVATISGNYNGSSRSIGFYTTGSNKTGLVAGNELVTEIEISLGAHENIAGIQVQCDTTEGGVTYGRYCGVVNRAFTLLSTGFSGIYRLPTRVLAATPTGLSVWVIVQFKNVGVSSPISGVVKLASASVRNL